MSSTLPILPLDLGVFQPAGDLAERLSANFFRLEEPRYQPVPGDTKGGGCFMTADKFYGWPGDMEGRVVLALTVLERATGRPARYLAETLRRFPDYFNARGYFGAVRPAGAAHEQTLSSHGWVLRGLCEHWLSRREQRTWDMLVGIVDNLALPTAGLHRAYPIDPALRPKEVGHVMGEDAMTLGPWVLSSDIGCDFIFMDGVVHAATLLKRPDLDALAEELIARFLQVDFVGISAQTHATLTGLRALLRWHEHRPRPELLAAVRSRFDLYRTKGCSENFSNWNWFNRPTHTEPCAVVDSFQIALQLWRATGEADYLEWAHLIYYNGLGHGQRANGGFGCDTVLGAPGTDHAEALSVILDEAWFCCSMRGAEGLAEAARHAACAQGDVLIFPLLHPGRVSHQGWELGIQSDYPEKGEVTVTVLASPGTRAGLSVAFAQPSWAENPAITANGGGGLSIHPRPDGLLEARWFSTGPGDRLHYRFGMTPRWSPPRRGDTRADFRAAWLGPVMHGAVAEQPNQEPDLLAALQVETEGLRAGDSGPLLRPLHDMRRHEPTPAYRRTVLWPFAGAAPRCC